VIADHIDGKRPEAVRAVVAPERVQELIALARAVHLAPALRRYVAQLTAATRGADGESLGVQLGASPRGSIALATCAQVRAAALGRTFVTDDDVQQLAGPVLAHRLSLRDADPDGAAALAVVGKVVASVPVPRSRDAGAVGAPVA
jgi:MoxR-like ATPase